MNVALPRHAMDELEAKQLLATYGVPVVREARALSVDAAASVAAHIGYPVALKALGAQFAHKTELGLVKLNLLDELAVRSAAAQLLGTMQGQGELLVQKMVNGKRELLVGMSRDEQFGATVTFGLGGIFTEILADVTLRIAPVNRADALEMLGEIRAAALLGPVRGLPEVDREPLVRTIMALSQLALDRPDIDAIDVNPLVICGNQPVAVDALVILK